MIRLSVILLITAISTLPVYTQNLLPDGSFEKINNSNCIDPEQGFKDIVDWYIIQGTPDLFSNNCTLQEPDEIFWSKNGAAFDGENYAGLRCRVNSNQSYLSEGLATRLEENLDADQAYLINLEVRNKGFYQGFPSSVISCPLKPQKQLEIYLHNEKIEVVNDFSNGSATCNGELASSIQSSILQSDKVSQDWSTIGTCFRTTKEVSYFALIMPLGNFGMFPECAADDTQGTFFSYYFEIDHIIIEKLPQIIEIEKFFKKGSDFEIYLPEEIDLSIPEGANYVWSDGFKGSRRALSDPGVYEIELQLDCGSLPVFLDLRLLEQEFPFFIPNVFSPNEDGINDALEVFIPKDEEVITFSMSVYDRWGNQIFGTTDYQQLWNGRSNQNAISPGQYIYHITCTLNGKTGEQKYKKSGLVMVAH